MKTLLVFSAMILLFTVSLVLVEPVYAESQTRSTEDGTLDIRLTYDEITTEQETAIKVEFLNPFTESVQVHIDYSFSITRDGEQVFGPTSRIHTSPGVVTIPILFQSNGVHLVDFIVDGILFQPIPAESASFDIVVGDMTTAVIIIPDWIKNNAGWWAQGEIDDATFVSALQYLIENKILIVPLTDNINDNNDASNTEIPPWIKNNAGWWAQGQIDDTTFVNALQYLIVQGIIQVS